MLRSVSSVNESRVNESRMRTLYFIPNLGYCTINNDNVGPFYLSQGCLVRGEKVGSCGVVLDVRHMSLVDYLTLDTYTPVFS